MPERNQENMKLWAIDRLLNERKNKFDKCLIFANSYDSMLKLYDFLYKQRGYRTEVMQSKIPRNKRDILLKEFHNSNINNCNINPQTFEILITCQTIARSIIFPKLSQIIAYDCAWDINKHLLTINVGIKNNMCYNQNIPIFFIIHPDAPVLKCVEKLHTIIDNHNHPKSQKNTQFCVRWMDSDWLKFCEKYIAKLF